MDVLWQVIYWGNLIQGSFVTKFYQQYWVSGHFSVASRIKATLKRLLMLIVVGSVLLVLLVCLAFYYYKDFMKEKFMGVAMTTILIISNVYGTLLLVVLLSYGLAFLPFSVWKRSNND